MNVAYFPGCSLHGMAKEYDISARLVCKHLGITLQEVEDWNCCGATAAHSMNHLLAVSLSARNLGQVRGMNLNQITTPCAGCFSRLKTASYEMRNNPTIAAQVESIIESPAPVEPEVSSLLQFLIEQIGLDEIKQKVTRSLKGLKVAAYYGCLLTRPRQITGFDDADQPVSLDEIMKALGAETVAWGHKAECCGGGYAASQTSIVMDLGGQILHSAHQAGAEAIVVACPMCQANLDTRQDAIGITQKNDHKMPIIYFTQLMGVAFGIQPAQLGMKRLLTSPMPLLRSKGLI
ncbi:MAG TPA: CoB--CoM heterodisulfide reductase iron-sulfur subunit B family protein [Syntrophomonadaceae bacterium]|nr:CoB--CoM heterodisulfide reductase iron-sulfur subunit B family protein [Syntrophomonadaceae bacterium]